MTIIATDANGSGKRCNVQAVVTGVDDAGNDIWAFVLQTANTNVVDTSIVLDDSLVTLIKIQDTFCDVIQAVTGLPTIQGDQDGPTPQGNYIELRIVDMDSSAHDIRKNVYTDEGSTETVRGQTYNKLEVMIIGTGAMQTGKQVINSMLSANRQFDLGLIIGYCGADGPQNMSEAWGGMFRQKALLNIYFYANIGTNVSVDYATNTTVEVVVPDIFDKTFTVTQ